MKKKIFIITIIACLFTLVGCTKDYDEEDVNDYIKDTIGIKNYSLDKNPKEKTDSDSYTDYYWHVKYEDIEFDVIDNYFYGLERVENKLETNFDQKVLDYYYSIYSETYNLKYKIDNEFNINVLTCEVANEQKEIDYKELQNCYNNIYKFIKTIDFKKYPISTIDVKISNKTDHVKWLHVYKNNKILSFDEFKKS